ncbi:MAG: C2H2-type zinc finger protein, partial [Promethearchaeota archaeon]
QFGIIMQYKCKECQRLFESKAAFSQHAQAKKHTGFVEIQSEQKTFQQISSKAAYKCNGCNKQFKTSQALLQHCQALQHVPAPSFPASKPKQYSCPQCQKLFGSPNALQNHLLATKHRSQMGKETRQLITQENQEKMSQLKPSVYSPAQCQDHSFVWEIGREDQGFERCTKCGKTRLEIEQQRGDKKE